MKYSGRVFGIIFFALMSLFPIARAQFLNDLDAPVSQAVIDFAQASIDLMKFSTSIETVRTPTMQPGWPLVSHAGWQFQYPPDWVLRDSSLIHAWVSDQRDLVHVLFVQIDQKPGNPSIEELFYMTLNNTIAEKSSSDQIRVIATDQTNLFGQYNMGGDTGLSQIWIYRWLHAQAGNMIAVVQVTVFSRGIYTAYAWSLLTAPETELSQQSQYAFVPIAASFYAVPPGSPSAEDKDDDGFPDNQDKYPDDPNKH